MAKKKTPKPKVVTPEVLDAREEDIEESEPDAAANANGANSRSTELVPILESRTPYTPTQVDLLRKYMEDVSRLPLLSPEEEFELAVKLTRTGDVDAARRLVTANLRLVVKIAMEYRNAYQNVMDLIQEGNVGLMKAVSKYDPTKGAKLSYYASWWIRSYILKYILDNFRLVRVGTTQAQKKLFFHLIREKERLEAQGLPAGPKLLADRLHVREQDVREMEQRLGSQGSELSLNAPLGGKEGGATSATHMDSLPDRAQSPEETLAEHELMGILKENLDAFATTLKEKELAVFSERMVSEHPKTLQEVADLFGLTRERARQIEVRVLEKLREFYRNLIA